MRLLRIASGLVLLFAATSCSVASKRLDAASVYAHHESCPAGQVIAIEQESPSLREAILEESPPPRDVASDPDRLELWVANHEERHGRTEGTSIRVYSAYGCTSSAVLVCADHWFGLTGCSVSGRSNTWR